ncbi:uncharacterized protein LOC128557141 [Mercenaria mercenaria]|uniref:uncharacterized protein LOC128557141 n=1 Tax=Mercenaria mercenaria TaxID=6596 RepID=UPI00234E6A9F|nr:uncharacterized protein LOC128557141 [Mercenaria mercenaria]
MADDLMYFLIQWEDRFMSVIDINHIVRPVKNKFAYKEGEIIRAQFGKKNSYEAVICEIHLTIVEDSKAGHLLVKPRPESITAWKLTVLKKVLSRFIYRVLLCTSGYVLPCLYCMFNV